MTWRTWILVAGLLAGCNKPADVTATPPSVPLTAAALAPAPTSATAGECAAILQNVQAGRDIVVNVQCDTPTEAKLIAALSNDKWEVLCPHVMPVHGWLTKNNEIAINAEIVPVPGSYWSQYGFKISVSPIGLSQVDFVYVNALSWEDTDEKLPTFGRESYTKIQQISTLYPPAPAAISHQAAELLISDDAQPISQFDASLRKRIVDQIALRRELAFEDGSQIDTLKLAVFREDDSLRTEVILLPYVDAYPNWSNDSTQPALQLSCNANKDVPLRTFKSLCTLFLERQSMSIRTTNGEACAAQRDGASTTGT